jgi:hypothetical protein
VAKDNKKSLPEGSLKIIEVYYYGSYFFGFYSSPYLKSDLKRGQFMDLLSKDHRITSLMLWMIWYST